MKLHLEDTLPLQRFCENILEVPPPKRNYSHPIGKHVERLIKYIEI
jgi:hypothetical protein